MIINSFDNKSESKINPKYGEDRWKCDVCIITFSYVIEQYVLSKFNPQKIGEISVVTAPIPVYKFEYKSKTIVFYKTYMGASAAVGCLEDVMQLIDVKKIVVFGGSGCLDKEIARGKVIVPTFAYRDEGTSYHYAMPKDYIKIKNSDAVANFMLNHNIPYIEGKTWTTDSFYRETINNMNARKAEGCISVEMECSAFQAVCDFRNLDLFFFLTSGDLLDAPEWDTRRVENDLSGTQHDSFHFDIALELACEI